jgi:hypothetical protein
MFADFWNQTYRQRSGTGYEASFDFATSDSSWQFTEQKTDPDYFFAPILSIFAFVQRRYH